MTAVVGVPYSKGKPLPFVLAMIDVESVQTAAWSAGLVLVAAAVGDGVVALAGGDL